MKNINYTDAGLHIMSLRVILRSFVCSQKVIFHSVIYISGSGVLSQCNAVLLIFTWAFFLFSFLSLVHSRVCVRLDARRNLSTLTDLALLQPDGDNIRIYSVCI